MTTVARLRDEIEGAVIEPGADGYDDARRVWNGMIDRRPAAIVRAASVGDIAPTIRRARELGLPLAVRGGGHNVAGNGTVDGGIVLDLGALTDVAVDPGRARGPGRARRDARRRRPGDRAARARRPGRRGVARPASPA